jgi:hypothetical protein
MFRYCENIRGRVGEMLPWWGSARRAGTRSRQILRPSPTSTAQEQVRRFAQHHFPLFSTLLAIPNPIGHHEKLVRRPSGRPGARHS